MIFVYKKWDDFCKKLHSLSKISIPAAEVSGDARNYIVLKHDVETDVSRAYELAKIENRYGHRGSFYVQAYLLHNEKSIEFLKKMQDMGHEISYHYDVMDSCKGNLEKAIAEFESNKIRFENNGFILKTLCQHGNPVVERIGYTSNRDFFRSEKVQALYPKLCDIMVDFKEKSKTDYTYFSDAGRHFQLIYDPINNDIINSDDKNIVYNDLNALYEALSGNCIISTHPHRWTSSSILYMAKTAIFKVVRTVAKVLVKIPFMKKLMSKYYYLAKKI